MKDDLLNICYKFFNRFIIGDELIDLLSNIDQSKASKKEITNLNNLVNKIKEVSKMYPNVEDEFIKEKKKNIQKMIDKLNSVPKDIDFINKSANNLKKQYEKEMDSMERWRKITECIIEDNYFNDSFESLSDYELLKFIGKYICAPFPPNLDQEEFDKLVKVGIEHNEKELLWRLAFNYEKRKMNFDVIADYYIKEKDGYYLRELICVVGHSLDIEKLINKIDDKDMIRDLIDNKSIISNYVSEDNFNKLMEKL